MNAETLARWMRMLEDAPGHEACQEPCCDCVGGYDQDAVDEIRKEIQAAWVEAVRKETA